ncbi:transglutaminase-like domain-containing protein [Thermoflavimicrobium daqui]|uniref:Transglutaminase n=1 Tax=Thermoflavimicrobium daqui TaxID=2137476 RepID=A0A364K1C9_9BACL|nr:transglutaminase domain-containing protein [Thermoflavimicrobium daqui]RAL21491.1 transglutaminase [Thermoflavimicrobium daqui]
MRKEKLVTSGLFLFFLVVLSLAACDYDWLRFGLPKPISSFEDLQAQTLNKRIPQRKIELSSYAKELGGSLTSPSYRQFAADAQVFVSGQIKAFKKRPNSYLWIQVNSLKPTMKGLPKSFDYYVPLRNGKFQQNIRLFAGIGEYRVIIRIADKQRYIPFASFYVKNVNPKIERDISYSQQVKQDQLKIAAPSSGYTIQDQFFTLAGKSSASNLMVQIHKDANVMRFPITVHKGEFSEQLPLLEGNGIYRIQVLLPDRSKKDGFVNGATLYIENKSKQEKIGIQFTELYKQRGILLSHPIEGYAQTRLTYRIAGKIDPKVSLARKTTHIVVQIDKGGTKATYFLPIRQNRFDGQIGLRFGMGMYDVVVFVPEITTQKNDYFRFYPIARFKVWNQTQKDLRDLMPSRGIESDHPIIKRLASRLTRGKRSDLEKAKAIFSYVAKNIHYDVRKLKNNSYAWDDSALKTLRLRKGVCQDFVFLSIALLRAANLPARFVEGEAGNQQHAWVEVWIAGRWVTMDPTWGSGVLNGQGGFTKKYDEFYFDPVPELIANTHTRKGVIY